MIHKQYNRLEGGGMGGGGCFTTGFQNVNSPKRKQGRFSLVNVYGPLSGSLMIFIITIRCDEKMCLFVFFCLFFFHYQCFHFKWDTNDLHFIAIM